MTNAVATRSAASATMLRTMAKGRALMAGTDGMRAAGELYLPKFEAEEAATYQGRLNASFLFNGYRKTVRDMTGRVFDKPVELGEGIDARIVDWATNIDLQGNDLSTFARKVFQDGLSGAGVSYIMVDAPVRDGEVTQADVAVMNLRPVFIHLRPEDILGWKSEAINNVTVLTQVRILEAVSKDTSEFEQEDTEQVRVLDRADDGVYVRIFQKDTDGNWVQIAEAVKTGLSEITIVPFYANRSGFFTGEPLLDDLADTNIAHWQSQSDQRNILRAARVPILHKTGHTDGDEISIGSGTAVVSSALEARLEWVEHSGAAIASGRTDLKDLEFQMETHGLQLLIANGNQSATGEALDSAKETSQLSMTADQLQDALEQALVWMAEYAGISDSNAGVVVNKRFSTMQMTAQDFTALLSAVNTGQMSRETFWAQISSSGYMLQPIDPELEADRVEGDDVMNGVTDG